MILTDPMEKNVLKIEIFSLDTPAFRKPFGGSHFVVGRDHPGVQNDDGPYAAQRISRFEPSETGIVPIFFEAVFYCRRCGYIASPKTSPHKP